MNDFDYYNACAIAAMSALIAKVPLQDRDRGDPADKIGYEICESADRYASDMVRIRRARMGTADIAPVVCETLPLCGDRRAQGPANAALIAAMHTMLPKLLAVCEAARACDDTPVTDGGWVRVRYDLRAALRALDNT